MLSGRSEAEFSMSAFSGLLALRLYCSTHPDVPAADAISALKRLSPDDGYHDYQSALALDGRLSGSVDLGQPQAFFRQVLTAIVQQRRPWWIRFAPVGRSRLRSVLSDKEQQCFEAAGLFAEVPDQSVLAWWDELANDVRANRDARNLLQGREAERLTLAHEAERLAGLGILFRPRWIAIEDNSAGYDVHSYDVGPVEPVARLIEVKSCATPSREIFLTRNEWETALQRAPHYWFHVWMLPERKLFEIAPGELRLHVPENRGAGLWQLAVITLPIAAS